MSTVDTTPRLPMKRQQASSLRTRYYAKLGILPPAPKKESESAARSSAPSLLSSAPQAPQPPLLKRSPSCLRHKRSTTPPPQQQRVSFHPDVLLYRIKHHEDYTDEEWNNMWVDSDTLDYEKDRNAYEYHADGANWRKATEEDDFEALDGTLIHPATWYAYRRHWEKHGDCDTPPVNFRGLLQQQQQQSSLLRRRWSPIPIKQRKTFWLLDLALESVQKGRNAMGDSQRRHQQQQQQQLRNSTMTAQRKPPRQSDRGWP